MKKTKLPPQAILVLVVVGLIAVAGGGYFMLVGPQKAKAVSLEKDIEATQAQIVESRTRVATTQKVEPIKIANLFKLAKAMPDQPDMSGVLLQLNGIAADTGITFESITPLPTVPQVGYQVAPIQLVFAGNFYNLSDLLFRLRNLVSVEGGRLDATGRLFAVDSISFAEAPAGFPQITASLTVDAFVYGTAALPGVAAPATTSTDTTSSTTDTTSTTTTPAPTGAAVTTPNPVAPAGGGASAAGAP